MRNAAYAERSRDFGYHCRIDRNDRQFRGCGFVELIDQFDEIKGIAEQVETRVVRHARTITFQFTEVAMADTLVRAILTAIRRLRAPPSCA